MTTALIVQVAKIVAASVFAFGLGAAKAEAMPPFAQAYGYDCQKCHIEVPALNSYGRYVQRSMYSALDRSTLARGVPIWSGETVQYDTQASNDPHRTQFGNFAFHGVGFAAPNITYHIQQWLSQNDMPGGLDTAWVSYDHIFGQQTHLVIGKMPPPGPSYFSQWSDFSGFAVPSITVGEHPQGLQNNRWGYKLGYAGERFVVDAGWFGSSADLNGATDFSANIDKTFQWHLAYAPLDHPVQVGIYGNTGTFPLSEGGIDRYASAAIYTQLDPTARAPGALLALQRGWDGNSGQQTPATSTGYTAALFFRPLKRWESLINLRHELTNDGLGGVSQTNSLNVSARVARYVHATVEAATQTGGKPAFRYFIWWTTPMRSALPPLAEATQAIPASSPASTGASSAAPNATASAAAPATMVAHIKNFAYSPATITIKAGTTVQFINDDSTAHTITASDKSFDSGGMKLNASWSHAFTQPGTYAYICTYHPYMKGTVVVTGASVATQPRAAAAHARPSTQNAAKPSQIVVTKHVGSAPGTITVKVIVQVTQGAPAPQAHATASKARQASGGVSHSSHAVVVHIKNFAYVPATITIKAGDTVRFINDDSVAHTVTASDKSFDSGNMNQNATWSHTFTRPGTYAYICTYHQYMKGTVVVK